MSPTVKSVAIAMILGLLSAILFGIGLVGPLTPSEGRPSIVAWEICAALPILLSLIAATISKDWIVRIALLAEFAVVLTVTIHLLRLFQVV